jgi:hypothetical protein
MILIGSVFTSDQNQKKWYELQLKFIQKTTKNFKHIVFLNGNCDEDHFSQSEIVGRNEGEFGKTPGLTQTYSHSIGLECIIRYFRNYQADNYLILDSDCFPIMQNWDSILLNKMELDYNPDFASPVRFEQLELFPHPCAVFIKGSSMQKEYFDNIVKIARVKNLLQTNMQDNSCGMPIEKCYPLLKSNVVSPHPVFAIIYNHLFYHHGSGARFPKTRAITQGYFDHYISQKAHAVRHKMLFEKLFENPDEFIHWLAGTKEDIKLFL